MILRKGKLVLFRAYEVKCAGCELEKMITFETVTRKKAVKELEEAEWKKKKGKWYCPEC